jgi:nucleosome binding factor SPN SPT16 subunit
VAELTPTSSQAQESNYLYLLSLQQFVIGELKDGAVARDIYIKTVEKITTDKPDLVQYFLKSLGFGVSCRSLGETDRCNL